MTHWITELWKCSNVGTSNTNLLRKKQWLIKTLSQVTFAFITSSQKFNSKKLVFTHHYLHLLCVVIYTGWAHGLGETGGQCWAFVWEGALLRGAEASSAVLKATVTRMPERRVFRIITADTPFNMLMSKTSCVYIGIRIRSTECARFIKRQLNNYFCGKMRCSNY